MNTFKILENIDSKLTQVARLRTLAADTSLSWVPNACLHETAAFSPLWYWFGVGPPQLVSQAFKIPASAVCVTQTSLTFCSVLRCHGNNVGYLLPRCWAAWRHQIQACLLLRIPLPPSCYWNVGCLAGIASCHMPHKIPLSFWTTASARFFDGRNTRSPARKGDFHCFATQQRDRILLCMLPGSQEDEFSPILDLCHLNTCIACKPFLTIKHLQPGDWFTTIDLKNTYFHVKVLQNTESTDRDLGAQY